MEDYFDPGIMEAFSKREQYVKEARDYNQLRQAALNQKAPEVEVRDSPCGYCCCEEALRS